MAGAWLLVDVCAARHAQKSMIHALGAYLSSCLLTAKLAHAGLGWSHAGAGQWISPSKRHALYSTDCTQPKLSNESVAAFIQRFLKFEAAFQFP